ncbi:carboxypeptidase-like regulatory domain-containing protein [Trinickia sp.]|uniref:carboxypeptidase-like regulatory domain-containing protein n=1 Tax=Trinickia sp. TaxID=2571163 RepID=UPI003F7D69F4
MMKYINSVANSTTGLPVQNASVQVNIQGGAAATLYADDGVTTIANPLTTDANGQYAFKAADGTYQLIISGNNIATQTINNVLLVDALPADLPTSLPATSGKLWNNGGALSVS